MSIAFVLFIGLLCYFKGLRIFCAVLLFVAACLLLFNSAELEAGNGVSQYDLFMLQSQVQMLESRVSMLETQQLHWH